MMARWYSGTLGPKASLQVRKTPEKTSPRKLVPTGDRTQVRCVTGVHATTWPTVVDHAFYIELLFTHTPAPRQGATDDNQTQMEFGKIQPWGEVIKIELPILLGSKITICSLVLYLIYYSVFPLLFYNRLMFFYVKVMDCLLLHFQIHTHKLDQHILKVL